MSKVLEKVAYVQLHAYLDLNEIGEKFQLGFKMRHSNDSVPLKVLNYLLTVDAGKSAVLLLLDLSATFDTVAHSNLLTHLKSLVGIQGIALNWL